MAETRQDTAFSDPSDLVARRMGFIPLPLSVAMGRVLCTTLTPSAKPANFILLILAYLILVALRVLTSLVILGKACDLIAAHANKSEMETQPKRKSSRDYATDGMDSMDPNLAMAILSNSAVSLNNVCLNDTFVKTEKPCKSDKHSKTCNEECVSFSKHVSRAESEPLLPQ